MREFLIKSMHDMFTINIFIDDTDEKVYNIIKESVEYWEYMDDGCGETRVYTRWCEYASDVLIETLLDSYPFYDDKDDILDKFMEHDAFFYVKMLFKDGKVKMDYECDIFEEVFAIRHVKEIDNG